MVAHDGRDAVQQFLYLAEKKVFEHNFHCFILHG